MRRFFKTQNSRNFERSGNDSRMWSLSPEISDKTFYLFQLYLTGFCRRKVDSHKNDPFPNITNIQSFCTNQVLHNAFRYVDDIYHSTLQIRVRHISEHIFNIRYDIFEGPFSIYQFFFYGFDSFAVKHLVFIQDLMSFKYMDVLL